MYPPLRSRRVAGWALALLSALVWARPGWAEEQVARRIEAQRLEAPPSLDGDLSDWPEPSAQATASLDSESQALPARRSAWEGTADASARFRLAVYEDDLYLGASIEDDVLLHPGQPWWHGDSLELFLDTSWAPGRPRSDTFGDGCWQIFLMPLNPELNWGVAFEGARRRFDAGGLQGVRVVHRVRPGGYDLEARVPLAQLGIRTREAREIGFALALNDADEGPGTPGTYLSWNGQFELYLHPDHFGTLALPARAAAAVGPRSSGALASWAEWVLAVLLALAAVLLLAGPGARLMTRWGPAPKAILLVLLALLAIVYTVEADREEARAVAEVRQDLECLATRAEEVVREATAVGALPIDDPAARRRVLGELLRGRQVPAVLPPEAVAFVSLRDTPPGPDRIVHRLPLDRARTFHLAGPVDAAAFDVEIERPRVAARDSEPPTAVRIGSLTLAGPAGISGPHEITAHDAEATRFTTRIAVEGSGPWERLVWDAAPEASGAHLVAVRAIDRDEEASPLLVSGATDDGIPVLGGPGVPALHRDVDVGTSQRLDLPYLLGADRLWLVLVGAQAFPLTLGEDVAARLRIHYDRGDADEMEIRNALHLVAEVLPTGIRRPPDVRSRVAWAWTDERGARHTQDAIAVRLDPSRRALAVEIGNEGAAGRLRFVAATLARPVQPGRDAALGVAKGDEKGTDAVFVLHPAPAFEAGLGPGRPDDVVLQRAVGPEDRRTRLSLAAPLPERVASKRERTRIALLTCLALGLVLLAFLAADAVERFRRLTLRLAFGVLVAALVPLGAAILMVDRSTSHRLESEHVARARTVLATVRSALREQEAQAREAAEQLAAHLASEPGLLDGERAARVARLYRAGRLPAGTARLTIVSGPEGLLLSVPGEDGAETIQGPRFLREHAEEDGLHVSPWDGLLLVGSARRDIGEHWVRVTVGVRMDDAFLDATLRPALANDEAAAAVLDRTGTPIASTGAGGVSFREALARNARFEAGADPPATDLVDAFVTPEDPAQGTRLAVLGAYGDTGSDRDTPWLAVGLPRTPIDLALEAQREQLLWLALFGVILIAGVASLTARRVADPIKELVRVTEAVRHGSFDVEVPAAGSDEVGDLTLAFDQMRLDLRRRVNDLDFLRRAQAALAANLDLGERAGVALDLLAECVAPDAMVLLDAPSAGSPIGVAAERGRRTRLSDRTLRAAPGGWIEAALRSDEPVEIAAPAQDARVEAEGALGRRLVEDRPAWLAVPLRSGGETAGLAVLAWDDPAALPGPGDRRLLEPLAGMVAIALANAHLYRLAALDDVTRLPGTTAFEAALREDVERAASGGPPVVLLRIGLDQLEHVTFRRGVEQARHLLRTLAEALRQVAGDVAQLGRLREDEFGVRLVDVTRVEAYERANVIREHLRQAEVVPEEGGETIATPVTIGAARAPDDATSVEFLLDAAGRALAAARREGGDRVEDAGRLDAGLVDVPPYEDGAVFRSERMVRLVEAARRAARTDASVLVTGETGTGKEVIANLIHRRSVRAERPYVKVNCAAFPETLLESELFGHERGAFTGADRRREGRFELADGGTLFLDEIAEMTPSAQVKLLRVLQEHQFTRLGGTRPVSVDVRIVAATNRDLERSVADGSFREDLYYRLNVIRLEIPPLRERREEIPLFVERFLEEAHRRTGRGPTRLTSAAMDVLYRHAWPGNVRELKNAIERCTVLCDEVEVGPEHLRLDAGRSNGGTLPRAAPLDDLNERQRKLLEHLARHGRCTNRQYYEMTDTSPRTGLRDLKDLIGRGLVIREGKRRGAVYRLP